MIDLKCFKEWYRKLGVLEQKCQLTKFVLWFGRTILRRLMYRKHKGQIDYLATATSQVMYDSGQKGTMFEPVAHHIIWKKIGVNYNWGVIDIPYYNNIRKAKREYVVLESYLELSHLPGLIFQWLGLWIDHPGDPYYKYYALRDLVEIHCYDRLFFILQTKKYITFDFLSPYGMRGLISANNLGIDTIGIQHGFFSLHPETTHSIDTIQDMPLPKKILVWGEEAKRRLIDKCYINAEIIRVVGSTRYDYTLTRKKELSNIILVIMQNDSFCEDLPDIVDDASDDEANIIIKLHPGDKRKYFDNPARHLTFSCGDLYQLLQNCACVVAMSSSAIFEASIFEKPYIIYFPNYYDESFMRKEYYASSKQELSTLIKKVMKDDKYRKSILDMQQAVLRNNCFKIDGNACFRAAGELA